jgi:choline dehydrogenase-like flavoprotein
MILSDFSERPLSPLSRNFLSRYKQKSTVLNKKNLYCGRLRSAVLTKAHNGRPPYEPLMQDFFQTRDPAVYSPAFTLQQLIADSALTYCPGLLVTRYEEKDSQVQVHAVNLKNRKTETFVTKKLFVGAGAINTARIVLQSNNDFSTALPLLDNPVVFIPFIDPFLLGSTSPGNVYPGAELVMVHDNSPEEAPIQGSVYGLYGPMRTDLLAEMPFNITANMLAVKYLGPALGMLQLFLPDTPSPENFLALERDGTLVLSSKSALEKVESHKAHIPVCIQALHSLKFITARSLCKFPAPGSSIHYAGSLPMSHNPNNPYQTYTSGLLQHTKNVYIIDAANFPCLPSKNHTFTIMANAMRIAESA